MGGPAKAGAEKQAIDDMMKEETWLTAQQAKDLGFVTEIITTIQAVAKFNLNKNTNVMDKKAFETKDSLFVMLLPASTHTKYFHEYIYHNPNCKIEFLRKPKMGFRFGKDDGSEDDLKRMGYIKSLMIIEMDNR